MGIREPTCEVEWNRDSWGEAKSLVQRIEEDYSMFNQEIQDKILEILRNKAE